MIYFLGDKKGQLAPFFIILIAILITALIVTANIGKIGLHRVNTANASDSAALAGATVMANGLTGIMFFNTQPIFTTYLEAQIVLGTCLLHCSAVPAVYALFLIAQIYNWLYVRDTMTSDIEEDAEDTARQLGFSNAGIDEPKPRLEEETWEEWRKRKGRFGEWMEDKEYKHENTYAWCDDGSDDCEQEERNWVRVEADAPRYRIALPVILPIIVFCNAGHPLVCGFGGIYPFPAFIPAIPNDDENISVRVTRWEPEKNLGLWRMRYGQISSYAEAEAFDGNIRPEPLGGEEYDSRLERTE